MGTMRMSVNCDGKKNALFLVNMIKPWSPFEAEGFAAVRPLETLQFPLKDLFVLFRGRLSRSLIQPACIFLSVTQTL